MYLKKKKAVSGVYQLKFLDCPKKYVSQRGKYYERDLKKT
jgi:hypothetical protein